jgi:CheY-like chemotaxis protein
MNVLVVDDNKAVQEKLVSCILSRGHCVDSAVNGLDALGKIQATHYDLYLIDHLMPLMNGIKLVKNLKANPITSDIPIIFMTTQGVSALKNIVEFTLFNTVIEKPINNDELLTILTDFENNNFQSLEADNGALRTHTLY